MCNDDNKIDYSNFKDICHYHGWIVYLLYRIFYLSEWTTFTRLWFHFGEFVNKTWTYNNGYKKPTPLWHDIGVFLHILFTILISIWHPSNLFAWYLIVDMIAYHSRVLWFDDLIPDRTRKQNKVHSHRRILFQSLINLAESIFLFGVLYMNYCVSSLCKAQIFQASFEVATTLGRPDSLSSCPSWLLNSQIFISIFFLVVVLSVIASAGYKRGEIAP